MFNSLKTLTGILLAASSIGCATPVQTQVGFLCISQPKYASIYDHRGTLIGVCPTWAYCVNVTAEDRLRGYIKGKIDFKARWISGAEKNYILRNPLVDNTTRKIVFSRPAEAPRPELDIAYELQKDRLEIERDRTKLMEKQTDSQSGANQRGNIGTGLELIQILGPAYQNTYGK